MAEETGIPGMGDAGKQDPLQGYDIKVETVSADAKNPSLVGAFTSLMFKIVNQTETYLPLNSRIPRMLDGEVIVVWSLEQGLVEMDVVSNTFGNDFAAGFAKGREFKVNRSRRFNIKFFMNAMIGTTQNETTWEVGKVATNANAFIKATDATSGQNGYMIKLCRVDTFSFGVAAGRHVVANAWQGTGQNLEKLAAAA